MELLQVVDRGFASLFSLRLLLLRQVLRSVFLLHDRRVVVICPAIGCYTPRRLTKELLFAVITHLIYHPRKLFLEVGVT